MPPATPIIQTFDSVPPSGRYSSLPSWLLSLIVHMLVVIGLGLLHISTTPGSNIRLLFAPTQSNAEAEEPDTLGLTDIDVALESDAALTNVSEVVPAASAESDMLTNLEADWSEVLGAEGGADSLISGLGNGTIGELAGGKNYASLFGLSGEGGKFVYLFDRSESMNSVFTLYSEGQVVSMVTPLLSAKKELIRSLESLSKANRFQIIFYNDSPLLFGESQNNDQLFQATDENKALARAFIEQMPGEGFTNHLGALEAGISLAPDVIFLLTDAEAKDDLHPSVVRRIYKYCQRRNIKINVVHFCRAPRPDCTLIELAEKTGGEHLFISLESLAQSMIGQASF